MEQPIEHLMNETSEHYERKMAELWTENKRLKRENVGLKGKNRGLKRSIRRLKGELEAATKLEQTRQHYKNGRRGTRLNG